MKGTLILVKRNCKEAIITGWENRGRLIMVANVVTRSIMTWHMCLGHMSKHGLNVLLDRDYFSV